MHELQALETSPLTGAPIAYFPLSRFLFSAIRYHLRYVLNPEVPPITVGSAPPKNKAEPVLMISPEDGDQLQNHDDVAAVMCHALCVMHTTYPGAGPFDVPCATVEDAQSILEYTDAHTFVRRLLSWPGLMHGSTRAAAFSWAEIQRYVKVLNDVNRLANVCGQGGAHEATSTNQRGGNAQYLAQLCDLPALTRRLREERDSIKEVAQMAEEVIAELCPRRAQQRLVMEQRTTYPALVPFEPEPISE